MIKYILLILLVWLIPAHINSNQDNYKLDPDSSYVDNVHYDKNLGVIVINVHAKVLWMNINEAYGIIVNNNCSTWNINIDEELKRVLGGEVKIIHLKKVE